jgi:hypothetical protein
VVDIVEIPQGQKVRLLSDCGSFRPYTAESVVAKRGTLKQDYASNTQAKKLFALLEKHASVRISIDLTYNQEGTPTHTFGALDPIHGITPEIGDADCSLPNGKVSGNSLCLRLAMLLDCFHLKRTGPGSCRLSHGHRPK